ncbi:MAG TPA: sulfatase, partial [Opitutae bacterium]|nr:sulfatase [Opitutae bacterium]
PLDGVNLEPYVNQKITIAPHAALFWRANNGSSWCVRTPEAKLLFDSHGVQQPELYDMANDPYESTNLIDKRPQL